MWFVSGVRHMSMSSPFTSTAPSAAMGAYSAIDLTSVPAPTWTHISDRSAGIVLPSKSDVVDVSVIRSSETDFLL